MHEAQISLDVGDARGHAGRELPVVASFRVAAKLPGRQELKHLELCRVTITGPDGELLAEADLHCAAVAFVHRHPKDGIEHIERVHTVKQDDR